MPEIARFYGLIIKMFFAVREHNPPHFHALYGEYSGINTLSMLEGDLPPRSGQGFTKRSFSQCGIHERHTACPL